MKDDETIENPTPEQLAAQEKRRVEAVAQMMGMGLGDNVKGAMIIVANDAGVSTYPYVAADENPFQFALWMLGAHIAHLWDSTPEDVGMEDVAQYAIELAGDPEPSERGERNP